MRRESTASTVQPVLLRVQDVAALLQVSQRAVWAWGYSGRIPPPIKIGGCVRWRRADILAFIEQAEPAE